MKLFLTGVAMIILALAGIIAMVVVFGGNHPYADPGIDTKAQIGSAVCIVGIIGVVVLLIAVWREGRRASVT